MYYYGLLHYVSDSSVIIVMLLQGIIAKSQMFFPKKAVPFNYMFLLSKLWLDKKTLYATILYLDYTLKAISLHSRAQLEHIWIVLLKGCLIEFAKNTSLLLTILYLDW